MESWTEVDEMLRDSSWDLYCSHSVKSFLLARLREEILGCKSGVVVEKFGIVGLGRRKHGVKVAIVFDQLLVLFLKVCRGSIGKDSGSFKDVECFGLFHTANFGIRWFWFTSMGFGKMTFAVFDRGIRSKRSGRYK